MKLKQFKILTAAAAGILFSTVAFAQEEQLSDTSSFADFTATLTITKYVMIQNVADITIDGSLQDVGNNYYGEDAAVCFFTNSTAGMDATVTSTPSFAFNNTSSTPFYLEIDSGDGTGAVTFTSASATNTIASGAHNSITGGNCDTDDGSIRVLVTEDDYTNAVGGGTSAVTVTVAPN